MAIAVRQTSDQVARSDGYIDSLAKLAPGEVVIVYAATLQADGLGGGCTAHWTIMAIFTALTPVILYLSSRRARVIAPQLQYVMRTATFALFALGMDSVLLECLRIVQWMPSVGSLVFVVLGAYILAPAN